MRCTLSQSSLAHILSFIQTALPTRPPLPILSSLHLQVTKQELIVSATDLYFGVQARCKATVEEEGSLAVPGKQAIELFRNLPAGELELSTTDRTLQIKTQHITSTLQCQPPDDFPVFPETDGQQTTLKTSIVSQLVSQVTISCSPDLARPLLTGVLWEPGNTSAFVATDGFRLSQWRPGVPWDVGERLVVPSRFWTEVEKTAVAEKQDAVTLAYSLEQKQITATFDSVTIYSRTLEGEYPPYEKIIPTDFVTTITLQAEELLEQVRRSLLYARDSLGTIQLQFAPDRSIITAQSTSLGKFEAVLTTAQVNGDGMSIAFNSRYLLDFLQLVKSGEVTIKLNGELKPALFEAAKQEGLTYVVMPFRVNQ